MELSDEQFKGSVYDYDTGEIKAARPVVIDFFTDWCGSCKAFAPVLDTMARKFDGLIDVVKVNITKSDALANALNIQGVPTLLFLRPDTKRQETMVGAATPAVMERAITDYLL